MNDTTSTLDWPAHRREVRPWRQLHRAGTRDDRTLREISVSLPPFIADRTLSLDSSLAADLETAMRQITALDAAHDSTLRALGLLLLRTESVASSKIESVEASLDDYACALHGIRANASAVSMAAATAALDSMIHNVSPGRPITLDDIITAHALLMADEHSEAHYAGRLRDMQNWIGGSDHSPRAALYVPPPPDTVPTYMTDLLAFANRDDMPALAQAAIAHAQFESIHPFTDGNGRIGRALINTILRRRRATTHIVVPLASALVAHRERYFELLGAYRDGQVGPLLASFARACRTAAAEAATTATRLSEIPSEWRSLAGPVRAGSAAAKLLDLLPTQPIVSSEDACSGVDAPRSSVFAAISRLHDAGVLRPLTARKRDQVWGAGAILDELDDLSLRIAHASQ
ncbi:MAG: Fic family protein [Kineosporiaceae bacterium]